MTYSQEVVRRARKRLADRKEDLESLRQARLQEVYNALPRVQEIDRQLRLSMVQAVQAAFAKGTDGQEGLAQVRQQNLALQAERKALIDAAFGADYLDESPLCPHCSGTGYVGSAMCSCLEELCCEEQKAMLSVLSAGTHDFAQFRLDYYADRPDPQHKVSPRAVMTRTFEICRQYAAGFSKNSGNLLFNGGTGLGKTFLSACIAHTVAGRGFSVAYESAPHLFAKLEKDRFHPDEA